MGPPTVADTGRKPRVKRMGSPSMTLQGDRVECRSSAGAGATFSFACKETAREPETLRGRGSLSTADRRSIVLEDPLRGRIPCVRWAGDWAGKSRRIPARLPEKYGRSCVLPGKVPQDAGIWSLSSIRRLRAPWVTAVRAPPTSASSRAFSATGARAGPRPKRTGPALR